MTHQGRLASVPVRLWCVDQCQVGYAFENWFGGIQSMTKKGALHWACVMCLAHLVTPICHAQSPNPDQPNKYGPSPTRFTATQFVTHHCRFKSPADIARVLRPLLPKTDDVQLVVDRDQSRLLVSGPENIQTMALRVVEALDQPQDGALGVGLEQMRSSPGAPSQRSIGPPARPKTGALPRIAAPREATLLTGDRQRSPERVLNQFVFVPRDRMTRVQQQLSAIFANRLQVRRLGEREVFLLTTATKSQSILELEYDVARSGVLIGGPEAAVQQLAKIVHTLASDGEGQQVRAKVFRVHRKNHSAVQEMVRPPNRLRGDSSSLRRPTDRGGAQLGAVQLGGVQPSGVRAASGVAPARYLYQEPGSEAAGQRPPVGQEGAGRPAPEAIDELPLRQFEGVEIESLPDLDVIILRGTDQELEQLAEIIQQLERISRETQPQVEIYHLRYANGEAVADLVAESSPDLVDTRAGRVSLTPLVKPNAIMLIGWGDAVQAVLQLIRQLDKPVSPQSQSTVFRIRHAPAGQVQETLESFFGARNGLGPRISTAVDPRTNSLIVHAAPRDMSEVRRIVEEIDRPDSSAVNRAHVFRIEHALAADVAATLQQAINAAGSNGDRSAILELQTFDAEGQRILRSGTLENVQITPNPRNNTLIVSSPPANLELIGALIKQLDTPGAQSQIKVFRIVNGDAAGLVETLRSLLPSQAGAIGPQLPSAPGETSLAPLRFSVEVRSNSVIATGSEGDLRIVEALLLKLDQSNTLQRKTHVYQLKNSPAVDVANAVNQFLVGQRQVERAAPGAESPFQELEKEVVVVPEPVANKLVLSATPRYFEEISTLIEKLDEQPPQVMIQVLIAEVALNNTDEFGVELGLQDSVLFDRSLLGDLLTTTNTTQTSTPAGIVSTTEEIIRAATNLPGFAFNNTAPLGNSGSTSSFQRADAVGGQGVSNFSVGRGNDQLGFGGLVLSASSRNVNVLLRALQESRRVDILSRPHIRTLDNQPAFIQVGQRVPRIIGSSVNQNGQSNSVALENVGLIMAVTPRISPEGNVVMEIDAEKSSLGPEQDGVPVAVSVDGTVVRSPRIDTTTAQTTVSAASGETIVLGGLITENKEEFHRQVPWLGDLPVLGQLFRYDGKAARRSELIIILTPRVIRSTDESDRIRQTEMARMSWCAADVFDLHGDVGLMTTHSAESLDNAAPQVIYPDLNPAGDVFPPLPQSQQEVPPVTFKQ